MSKKKQKKRGKSLLQAVNEICTPIFSEIYGSLLFLNWESVVGQNLAKISKPKSISRDKKVLVIEVKQGSMLEVQYQLQYILECVHFHLNDQSIQRIVVKLMDENPKIKLQKNNQNFTNLVLDIDNKDVRDALTRLYNAMNI